MNTNLLSINEETLEQDMMLHEREMALVNTMLQAHQSLLRLWPGKAEETNAPGSTIQSNQEELLVETKTDGSIVTLADKQSESILVGAIRQLYPEAWVMTEEDNTTHNIKHPDLWIIDPLDGTLSYKNGGDDFAILLSLIRNDTYEFSLIDFPAYNEIVLAKGSMAGALPPGVKFVSKIRESNSVCIHGVYCDILKERQCQWGIIDYHTGELESTRALLEVAKGTIDGVIVLMCGHKAWDVAALIHVVTASGAYITDERGSMVLLSGSTVLARYLIAARTEHLHCFLLEVVNRA